MNDLGMSITSSARGKFPASRESNGFLFISGQASTDGSGAFIPGSIEEEMQLAISNLKSVLEEAQLTMDDVVRVGAYLRDSEDLPRYNEVYMGYFSAPLPARTTLVGCLPPFMRFEIDAIGCITASNR